MSGDLGTLQMVPLDELRPHPKNVRTWDLPELMTMIVTTGWHGVVIQQKSTGYLLAGHGRREAVLALNALVYEHEEEPERHEAEPHPRCPRCIDTVDEFPMLALPTDVIDISDEDAARKVIGDNRIGELSSWNQPALASLLTFVQDTPRGLTGTGYTNSGLKDLLSKLNTKPTSLEELAKQNVDPDDFTKRIIKLSVQPSIFDRWEAILEAHDGKAEQAFVALLDR